MTDLVAQVAARIKKDGRATDCGPVRLSDPTTVERVHEAERRLGFNLPPMLIRLYTEFSNGRFGPGYGIAGVDGNGSDERKNDIVALHEGSCGDDFSRRWPNWPRNMLRLAYLGCAMHACIDCADTNFPVYLFEPNCDEADLGYPNNLVPFHMSFDERLLTWSNGEDVQLPKSMQEDFG
ncbi:SMI1/KNR4 family protein [Roseiconus lacunae]|uniref:SMI1/KNR4 family protein n=1 Tax=Roseiconus lacunae TaxID=2605694 RepID=A0ABT7PSJ0_9BACT|nr:SMI1/KNR4 family protein [Roseiconus lacunae]MDM4019467.1 SMI1/KNR4 family protein [Roseiconus lacunae]